MSLSEPEVMADQVSDVNVMSVGLLPVYNFTGFIVSEFLSCIPNR